MTAQAVPATASIRRRRVGNIDTYRLIRRRHFLIDLLILKGGRSLASRMDFAMRAAELTAIENELIRRCVLPQHIESIRVSGDPN